MSTVTPIQESGAFNNPLSKRIRELEAPLTVQERAKIVVQLGSAMLAGGLLCVGLWQKYYGSAGMRDVADFVIMLASLIVALPIFYIAAKGLFSRSATNTVMTEQLVALATLAAMANHDFLTATLIPIIMNLSHFLEERSILGAQSAIEGLRRLHSRSATILQEDGTEKEIPTNDLKVGDVCVVHPGDVIPADGDVLNGESTVDQSSITGESVPVDMNAGSSVFAGTVNLTGVMQIKVTKTGDLTALGRVVDLLRGAEQSKTPIMKLIEKYAVYYVPVILAVAGIVLFLYRDIGRAVAVLVVGCPGALILAGPTAMVAALAAASRLGILIKNTRFLEQMADVDTCILDKTGTVTIGALQLTEIRPTNEEVAKEWDTDKLLFEGFRLASASRHPASRAIVAAADAKGMKVKIESGRLSEISGKGVLLEESTETWYLGRYEWLRDEGFQLPPVPDFLGSLVWLGRKVQINETQTLVEALCCFMLADRPRPEARQALAELRKLGVDREIMLTGDRRQVAAQIGGDLGMDKIIAEVLPEQKLEVVASEKAKGRIVMMVGDGVNDAPALASGNVGVALGAVASDIALQSADVALLTNDLRRLPQTVDLARRTQWTIHVNILLGAGISILFVTLASMGYINALMGAILHNVGELFVIANSARLLQFGIDDE